MSGERGVCEFSGRASSMLGIEKEKKFQKIVVFVRHKWRLRTSNSEKQGTVAKKGFKE